MNTLWGDPGRRNNEWAAGQMPAGQNWGTVGQYGPIGGVGGASDIGYSGDPLAWQHLQTGNEEGYSPYGTGQASGYTPEFQKYLTDNGIQPRVQAGESGGELGFIQNGQRIGGDHKFSDRGDAFLGAMLLAGGVVGGAAAGVGAGSGELGAGLGGQEGLQTGIGAGGGFQGAGATDEFAAADGFLNEAPSQATGAQAIENAAVPGASSAAPSSGLWGSLGNAAKSAGGLLSDYGDYAKLATTVLGAFAGSKNNQGSTTTQNTIDPRIIPYIYGQNGQGGLLGAVNGLYAKQLAQGGLNPLQQQGLAMQQQTLMNPAYTHGFDQMRSAGSGLLGQGMAGNPFANGQMALAGQQMPPQMPQQQMQFGQNPPQMQFGQNPFGRMQAGGAGGLIRSNLGLGNA